MECPNCKSICRKNGFTKCGTQRFRCDTCRKSFVPEKSSPLGIMHLPMEDAIKVIHQLLEGSSVRSTSRLTGIDLKTILALLVHVGANCKKMMEAKLVGVCVNDFQADEIWSFIGCKEKTRVAKDFGNIYGDAYTFVGIERTSKLIVAWHLGKRAPADTQVFANKLDRATSGRFQVTTDGFGPYRNAIPDTFGDRVDFMQLIKVYGSNGVEEQRKYSPPSVISVDFDAISGLPEQARACTSHIERSNLSLRMATRRFTRLTNGFSKKWENHESALALWFAFYNFARVHMTLKTETPAMASGLEDHVWTIRELIEESAKF
jgi:transposase-like protein/IS1 family transposase